MMNYLSVDDISKEQVGEIFGIADDLKNNKLGLRLNDAILVLLFEKPSTRTRVSFEAAISQLGGHGIYIDSTNSQISRGESIGDTARVLSGYANFIAARLYDHKDILELAKHSSISVINALTDLEHPCQALSDLYTIQQYKKRLKGTRIAFLGDVAANTANSLMLLGTKLGAEIALVGPKEYAPNPTYLTRAREYGIVDVYNDVKEGLADADIIYTDTFVSMGEEKDKEQREKAFAPYQLNNEALSMARKDAFVMHCLPAHRGQEITSEVIDGPRSIVWEQAKNKLLLEKALMLYISEVEH